MRRRERTRGGCRPVEPTKAREYGLTWRGGWVSGGTKTWKMDASGSSAAAPSAPKWRPVSHPLRQDPPPGKGRRGAGGARIIGAGGRRRPPRAVEAFGCPAALSSAAAPPRAVGVIPTPRRRRRRSRSKR